MILKGQTKLLKPSPHPRQRRCSYGEKLLLAIGSESQGINLALLEVGLVVLDVKVDMIHIATNLVVVDVGDVVDGKGVTKGRTLRDLVEPGHQPQLWCGRRNGKGEGQGKGSNRDRVSIFGHIKIFEMLCFNTNC